MSAALLTGAGRTFDSLRVLNFRRFFFGQIVSQSGTWMETIAEAWLVLQLTHSGVILGLTTALQFLPVLLGASWGGLLADRFPKRRLVIITQATSAIPALALWALVASGRIEMWMIFVLVLVRGSIRAVDTPTRQAFISEMVGPERLANAVALNSALVNSARIFGPAIAGVLIATVGLSPCFLINGISFVAIVGCLVAMRPAELHPALTAPRRGRGALRDAARYVWATPELRLPLLLIGVIGTLAYNFRVSLPLLAEGAFHGGAPAYAALTTAMGIGAISGALAAATRNRPTPRLLIISATLFGCLILAVAYAPGFHAAVVLLVPMGAASILFSSTVNASLQLASAPEMRGRVMALYTMVFLGSTPLGSPLVGWVASALGPRAGLALGGIAALGVGLAAIFARRGNGEFAPPHRTGMRLSFSSPPRRSTRAPAVPRAARRGTAPHRPSGACAERVARKTG